MPSPFETQVVELARAMLTDREPLLSRAGLRAEFRGVNPFGELQIDFYRGNHLIETFEFFVERGGKPTATAPEIEEWLRREIEQVAYVRPS